jgi:isoleucyl-tRNA synthetase
MCPFLADYLYTELVGASTADSVHLCDWPIVEVALIDMDLESRMAVAREVVSLGRAARAEAGIKVRQPLRRALVFLAPGSALPPSGIVEDELNVDRVEYSAAMSDVLTYELHPNFRSVGPKLGERAQGLRAALAGLDAAKAGHTLEAGGTVTVEIDGERIDLDSGDLELRVRAEEGFAVSRAGAEVVALDLELDDDLRRRGAMRELVRQVQELRKGRGLEVTDHVELWVTGIDLGDAERVLLAREVLADEVRTARGDGDGVVMALADDLVATVWLSVVS